MYMLIVAATVAAHFLFVAYVVVGGFLALRWPLTDLERWARREGGMAPLPSASFIDHYITGVFYPRDATTLVQFAAFVVVVPGS